MSSERDKLMIKFLADRLALVLALCEDEAIDYWIEGDEEGEAFADRVKAVILYDDEGTRYRLAKLRGSNLFSGALKAVRARTKQVLVDLFKRREAA